MTPMARVTVKTQDGVPVARVDGEIDVSNDREIAARLTAAAGNDVPGLIVDLGGTTYLDSRGVHLLLSLSAQLARRQQALCVSVPEDSPVRRVLVLGGVEESVRLFSSVADAVAWLGAGP